MPRQQWKTSKGKRYSLTRTNRHKLRSRVVVGVLEVGVEATLHAFTTARFNKDDIMSKIVTL